MDVLRFHVRDSSDVNIITRNSRKNKNQLCDFRMYFGFLYGILFDGRIITRKTRKSHRNTENKKNRSSGSCRLSSPAPTQNPRNSTEYTKRGQGLIEGRAFSSKEDGIHPFSDFGVRGGRGAQYDRGCTRRLRPGARLRGGDYPFPPLSPFSCIPLICGLATKSTTSAEQISDLRFRGFCVGDGEETTWVPSSQFFLFRVFVEFFVNFV